MTDINMLLMSCGKYFPSSRMPEVKQMLQQLGPDRAAQVMSMGFKDPMTALLLGIFLGSLGLDRFYIGDTTMGILKLVVFAITFTVACLTCGVLFFLPYIWPIIDLIFIMDATKEKNYQKLYENIQYM